MERPMDNVPAPRMQARGDERLTSTLQAVLRRTSGAMESMAVPFPVPEMIVRVLVPQATPYNASDADSEPYLEERFRRERSPDSVLRYLEEPHVTEEARSCARCHELRLVYFVPKFAVNEQLTSAASAYCEACYRVVLASRPQPRDD
jgi:hypothetical protein